MTKLDLLIALEELPNDDCIVMFTLDGKNFQDFDSLDVWSGGNGPTFGVLVVRRAETLNRKRRDRNEV